MRERPTIEDLIEFLRAKREAGYRYPLATKKLGAPTIKGVIQAFPTLKFSRVPFPAHIWWGFLSNDAREMFMSWMRYEPAKHHPDSLIVLEENSRPISLTDMTNPHDQKGPLT